MNNEYFEVTYKGMTAEVDPAEGPHHFGPNRWEYRLTTDGEWRDLDIGNFPEVSKEVARIAAVKAIMARHSAELAAAYANLERARATVAALTVSDEPVVFNPVLRLKDELKSDGLV